MRSSQQEIKIDLKGLNEGMRKYFRESMADFWCDAEEAVQHIYIHLGIIPRINAQMTFPKPNGQCWYMEKDLGEALRKPESINAYIDMDAKDKVEMQQQQIIAEVEKLLESAGWSRTDEIAYKWSGEEEISLGGDPEAYGSKADVDVNNYQILWAVSYKNNADEKISQISRLMLNVIAECLAECFGDVWHIVQAGKGDVELVKSRMLNKQIVFMEIYKKILFSQF